MQTTEQINLKTYHLCTSIAYASVRETKVCSTLKIYKCYCARIQEVTLSFKYDLDVVSPLVLSPRLN